MARVLLLLPSATYRAPDFLDAARALDVEVVVASEQRQTLAGAMGDRDQGVEKDRWVVELIAEPLDAKAHALLEDSDVVIIGKDHEARMQAAPLHRGQNTAGVHVRQFPPEHGDIELRSRG